MHELQVALSLLEELALQPLAGAALVRDGAVERLQLLAGDRLAAAPLRRRLLLAMHALLLRPDAMRRWVSERGAQAAGAAEAAEAGGAEGAVATAEAEAAAGAAQGAAAQEEAAAGSVAEGGEGGSGGESGYSALARTLSRPQPPLLLAPLRRLFSLAALWEATEAFREAAVAAAAAQAAPPTVAAADKMTAPLLAALRSLHYALLRHGCLHSSCPPLAPPPPSPLPPPHWRAPSLRELQLLRAGGLWRSIAACAASPAARRSTLLGPLAAALSSLLHALVSSDAGALSLASDPPAAGLLCALGGGGGGGGGGDGGDGGGEDGESGSASWASRVAEYVRVRCEARCGEMWGDVGRDEPST